jgi:hypothetical protein
MPGLRKQALAEIIRTSLMLAGAHVSRGDFRRPAELPWDCEIQFRDGVTRKYGLFFWSVSHGGRTRSRDEFRVQAKLKQGRMLDTTGGTPILLGFFAARHVLQGGAALGPIPVDMTVYVAWDPLLHLYLGKSSSCQVPWSVLGKAYVDGVATTTRQLVSGETERIVACREECLAGYLRAAAGGHNVITHSGEVMQ